MITDIPSLPSANDTDTASADAWHRQRMDRIISATTTDPMARVTWLACEVGPVIHALGGYDARGLRHFLMWKAAWRLNIGFAVTCGGVLIGLLIGIVLGVYQQNAVLTAVAAAAIIALSIICLNAQRRYATTMLTWIRPGLRHTGEPLADWMRRWETTCPEAWRDIATNQTP